MSKLHVRIIGTGAVGLACGVLISDRGHCVRHVSLRGTHKPTLPMMVESTGGRRKGHYTPTYDTGHPPSDVTILAVAPGEMSAALAQWGPGLPTPHNCLNFCAHPDLTVDCTSVYPLMSAEISPDHGLILVTDSQVEVANVTNFNPGHTPNQPAPEVTDRLRVLGFAQAETVSQARFYARALQTAATYTVLLAIRDGLMFASDVRALLLTQVLQALQEVQAQAPEGAVLDFPPGSEEAFTQLATLIAHADKAAQGTGLAHNINCLLRHGRRKLIAHISPYRSAWERQWSALRMRPHTGGQALLARVMTECVTAGSG